MSATTGSLLFHINQREDRVMIVNLGQVSRQGEKAIEFRGHAGPMPDLRWCSPFRAVM